MINDEILMILTHTIYCWLLLQIYLCYLWLGLCSRVTYVSQTGVFGQNICFNWVWLNCLRHYKMSVLLMCFFMPTFVPWYMWGESLWVAYFIPALFRYALVLNATWLVNSAAHMWGNRPYDGKINPRENRFVAFSAIGTSDIHYMRPASWSELVYSPKVKWGIYNNSNLQRQCN